MKTALVSCLYLDGNDDQGNNRIDRNIRYVEYYEKIKKDIGFDDIILGDNCSSAESMRKFKEGIGINNSVKIHVFDKHIPRKGIFEYGYAWRMLHYFRELIQDGYEKIITIDSDGYILTKRLANYVNNCNEGWEAFWCAKYNFPEAAFHILNKDQFNFFLGYTSVPWERMNGIGAMELALPFTKVNKDFNTDRYGEDSIIQSPDWDYVGQTPLQMNLTFNKEN